MMLDNISQMYNIIYYEMIDAKIATKKIKGPIFIDHDGEVVDESNCFGKKVDVEITHPEY